MTANSRRGNPIQRLFKERFIERPARGRSLPELAEALERSGEALERRLTLAAATPGNVKQLRHIVAIERWGTRRLRVGLGEPFVLDENRVYKPPETATWDELRSTYAETRAATVATARELERANPAPDLAVLHNGLGNLTLRGWLRYLDNHATWEGRRIR